MAGGWDERILNHSNHSLIPQEWKKMRSGLRQNQGCVSSFQRLLLEAGTRWRGFNTLGLKHWFCAAAQGRSGPCSQAGLSKASLPKLSSSTDPSPGQARSRSGAQSCHISQGKDKHSL